MSDPFAPNVIVQENPCPRVIDSPKDVSVRNDPFATRVLIRDGQPPVVIPNVSLVRVVEGPTSNIDIGDLHYVFRQNSPMLIWYIFHGLGKFPSISAVDTTGREIHGDPVYTDLDHIVITWGYPVAGEAYLN